MECPNCGRKAEEGTNFCAHCGASLRSQALDRMIQDARRLVDANPEERFRALQPGPGLQVGRAR